MGYKIAVHMRENIRNGFRGDNLRSEPRWERQVCEACLENSEIDEVFSAWPQWISNNPPPPKFRNGFPIQRHNDAPLIVQDFWNNDHGFSPKGWLFNIYAGAAPLEQSLKNFIDNLKSRYHERLVFTYGYTGSVHIKTNLINMVGSDYAEELPVPSVPYVAVDDSFEKKILLWGQRWIFLRMEGSHVVGEVKDEMYKIFSWIAARLKKDPTLEFHLLSGYGPQDIEFRHYPPVADYFWSFDCVAPLREVKDRVVIHEGMDWQQTLNIYAKTKLVVSFAENYGGSPAECGMYGIPFIGRPLVNPLVDCPVYLSEDIHSPNYYNLLDKLCDDHEFYSKIGNGYRDFVAEHYTYSAFSKKLLSILKDRHMV